MADKENKEVLALGIKGARFTAEKLKEIILAFFKQKDLGNLQKTEMPYEDFQTSGGVTLINISITEENIGYFQPTSEEFGVNFSLKKDVQEDRYYVLFQAGDMDTIYRAMKSYVAVMEQAQSKELIQQKAFEEIQKDRTIPTEKEKNSTQKKEAEYEQ